MKKNADIRNNPEDDFVEAVEPEAETIPLEILPRVLQDWLKDLNYMGSSDLKKEYKRLLKIVGDYTKDGQQIPYPLKIRLEAIKDKIKY